MKEKIKLGFTGFLQVYFVAISTYFIANKLYLGVLIVAFAISFIWSFNIKKVAFGTMQDRIIYSIAAAFGSVAGLFTSELILRLL